MNKFSIPSTHVERQITDLIVEHFFTLYLSLSPYGWTESQTEKQIHSLHVGWRNFFSSCAFMSALGSGGKYVVRVQYSCGVVLVFSFWQKKFLVLRTYIVYNTVVQLCQFFGCGGK